MHVLILIFSLHVAVEAKLSVEVAVQVDELVGCKPETLILRGSSMTDGKYKNLHKKISKKKSTPCRDGSLHECTG